jgi:hypothetical protein
MMSEKVKENMLRRRANRRGLRVEKSRRRDPHALDFGRYWIIDASTNCLVAGANPNGCPGMTLDEVEEWLDDWDAAHDN